ncbi:MAG: VCBS repeat-containing protein [Bacteroidetes bacterium]|nr:VCBS repeat-containing protein [Bacteroidota bacterium]
MQHLPTLFKSNFKDLNNDGKADIVSASYLASTIRSWRGLGNGGFVAASNISPPNFPTGITVGNIDNLGNDEVVVTEFSGFGSADIEFYTVNSNLQLTLNNSIMFTPYSCNNIKLYDFDKDGFLDLIGGYSQNKNCYFRGTGSLTGFIDDTTLAEPGSYNFPPLYTNPTGYDDFIAYSSEYRPAHNNNLSVDALAPSQACNGKSLTVRTDYTGLSSYLWNTGDTTSSIVVSNEGNYFLTINSSPGCSFNSDTITLHFVNCASVWPGDANRDFIVNQDDLFPITYNYNDSGLTRATSSNVWAPWASSDWNTYFNFNDEKFIDCNGDGAINVFDTVAVSQNFSNTYAARPSDVIPQVTGTPQLFFVKIQQGATIGDTVILGLYAGTPGNGFNATSGFSINIAYDGSIVQTGTGNFEFDNNSFLGSRGTDWLSIERISGNAITSSIGIKSGALVNGDGKIGELSYILNQSLTSSYQFTYTISNSSYSGYAGQLLPLDQSSGAITFSTTGLTDIASSNLQILGSNPVRGGQEVVVSVAQFKGVLEARWMNMNGQIIDVQNKLANDNFLLLQAPITPGIYVLQITDGINRGYTKVVVGVGK